MRLTVQDQHAADGIGRAFELPLPEAVADDRGVADRSTPCGFLVALKRAADLRGHAKDVEELRRDTLAAQALRLGRAAERVGAIVVNCDVPQGAVVLAEIGKIRGAD